MARELLGPATTESDDPYAVLPVWRRITFQVLILAAALGAIVVASEILQPRIVAVVDRVLSLALVPLPLLLWLLVSVLPEYPLCPPPPSPHWRGGIVRLDRRRRRLAPDERVLQH